MNCKMKFKLEFDIETSADNMAEVLEIINSNIFKEFNEKIKDKTDIKVTPTITKIEI